MATAGLHGLGLRDRRRGRMHAALAGGAARTRLPPV